MAARSFGSHGEFIRPYIKSGMKVLDCGCDFQAAPKAAGRRKTKTILREDNGGNEGFSAFGLPDVGRRYFPWLASLPFVKIFRASLGENVSRDLGHLNAKCRMSFFIQMDPIQRAKAGDRSGIKKMAARSAGLPGKMAGQFS
jgi:hypothetical protein